MTSGEVKRLKREILEVKREMKAAGIAVRSCFNGGHSSDSLRHNTTLFRLKTALERATLTQ